MRGSVFVLPRQVRPSASGDQIATKETPGNFYFDLVCGHRVLAKTKENDRGELVPVPQKAEWRDCPECLAKYVDAGKPVPPCAFCRGRGEVTFGGGRSGPGGSTAWLSTRKCPACRGKTAPPLPKKESKA